MELLPIIVAILGTGGLGGGIYALLKLRPEAGQITVSAAQGAVIVQTGVIDSLVEENRRLQQRITDLEAAMRQLAEMRSKVDALETENHYLTEENKGLRERLQMVEAEVAGLRGPVTDHNGNVVERREEP